MRQGFSELVILLVVAVAFASVFFVANSQSQTFTLIRGSEGLPSLEVSSVVATPNPYADMLLPDMQLAPPKELYIVNSGGKKWLRFDTTFSNIGDGPMELVGEHDLDKGKTIATQRIKKKDGSVHEQVIGAFVYHPTHDHWHVDRYGQFQIYTYGLNGERRELLAQTDKFSFCLWDEHPFDLNMPNAPKTRQYPRCPENIQGNSVGWGDTYSASTPGQEIDITNIPDGNYLVRSVVNADNTIIEKDYLNNEAILYVKISGNRITVDDLSL